MSTPIEPETIHRFRSLFDGLQRAYGTYDDIGEPDERGKRKGKATTVHHPITDELVRQHLAGALSLGMVPVRGDATVRFGAIDLDIYDEGLNHAQLAQLLTREGLNLVPCRTKSGGLHLYLFASEAVPAAAMRKKLTSIAAMIGHGGAEIFPKQDKLGPKENGSWINMPYFGETRCAVLPDGDVLTLAQFLDLAEAARVGKEFFGKSATKDAFPDGPPCLNHLVKIGVQGTGSNTTLFNLGVYAKRAHAGTWKTEVENYNRGVLTPPLDFAEVGAIIKSLEKKEKTEGYGYQCSASPLMEHCDKALCRTRRYGVGSSGEVFPVLGPLTKYASLPPTYRFEVDGVLIPLDADQLFTYWQFKRECQMALNRVMPTIKQREWDTLLGKSLEQMDIQPMEDVSPEAVFWSYLEAFCERWSEMSDHNWEQIARGNAFTDCGRTYFRMTDLQRYLDSQKFRACSPQEIGAILKQREGATKVKNIAGGSVRLWSIPAFAGGSDTGPVPEVF